jgi:aldehyde dehydrogenase (NAD+)
VGTLISERRSYVAGRWIDGDEALPVENPADESHVADVAVTPLAEFRRAVAEARHAF